MAVEFRNVHFPPLADLSVSAPDACIIGILGEKGSGATELLRLAAALDQPSSGDVLVPGSGRYLGPLDSLQLAPAKLVAIDHTFALADALVRGRATVALDRLRAAGATILLASHDSTLLRSVCDEVWWLDAGKVRARASADEILDAYTRHVAAKFRAWGDRLSEPLAPAFRKGDGRAEIISLETIGGSGTATAIVQSGEELTVRAVVRYKDAVENPVVGIMLRTRIGLEVYGTNSELEKVRLGPFAAGHTVTVDFRFRCNLCPKEYTVTAASHDPDGTAHDWVDDAVAFQVVDSRYTAGVANLKASVHIG